MSRIKIYNKGLKDDKLGLESKMYQTPKMIPGAPAVSIPVRNMANMLRVINGPDIKEGGVGGVIIKRPARSNRITISCCAGNRYRAMG